MLLRIVLLCGFCISSVSASWLKDIQSNLAKAFRPSEFICTKYENQEYEAIVLKPGLNLPFTELQPKTRKCIRWTQADQSALGRSCAEYAYVNSSSQENQALYTKVKRYRTVCVDGYSTR